MIRKQYKVSGNEIQMLIGRLKCNSQWIKQMWNGCIKNNL